MNMSKDCQECPQYDFLSKSHGKSCWWGRPQHWFWNAAERLEIRPLARVCIDPDYVQKIMERYDAELHRLADDTTRTCAGEFTDTGVRVSDRDGYRNG